jgi:hypothetical protein
LARPTCSVVQNIGFKLRDDAMTNNMAALKKIKKTAGFVHILSETVRILSKAVPV